MYDDSLEEVDRKIDSINDGKIKIRGNLYWCDSDNIKHPLEEISVKLYKDTGYKGLFYNTLTDEDGYYEFEFDYSEYIDNYFPDLYLYIESFALGSYVKRTIGDLYTFTSSLYKGLSNNETVISNTYYYPDKSDRAAAFQITQLFLVSRAYVLDMDETYMPSIDVHYPGINGYGCYYSDDFNYISIEKDRHNYFDPIMHEYGHYVSKYFGLCNLKIGGNHSVNADLIEERGYKNGLFFCVL